jgi:hypothetical protein
VTGCPQKLTRQTTLGAVVRPGALHLKFCVVSVSGPSYLAIGFVRSAISDLV